MSELPILPGCVLCGDPATNDHALQLVLVSDGTGAIRARWLHCPNFGSRVLSASAVVAYVAVGAAPILSRSVTEAVGRTRVGPDTGGEGAAVEEVVRLRTGGCAVVF